MSEEYKVYIKLGYDNTDFKRQITFNDVPESIVASVKQNVINYNSNLPATDKNIFIADDYDSVQGIGTLSGIVEAKIEHIQETIVYNGGE